MNIEQVLKEEGVYVSTTSGVSMYPMLRNRRDTIVVRPTTERLRKYDVPLYKRGSEYVLHRIVKVLPDSYVICGDNCINLEYDIKDEQILGVLCECYRGERKLNMDGLGYQCYVRVWCAIRPLRVVYKKCRYIFAKLFKKLR